MPRYQLNIAFAGRHYAKVILNASSEADAKAMARVIRDNMGSAFTCTLSRWIERGEELSF